MLKNLENRKINFRHFFLRFFPLARSVNNFRSWICEDPWTTFLAVLSDFKHVVPEAWTMYDREFSTTGQNRTVVSYSRLSHMHGGFLTGVQNKKQFRASWRRVRFLIRQKHRRRRPSNVNSDQIHYSSTWNKASFGINTCSPKWNDNY